MEVKRVHIITRKRGWAVKKEGAARAIKIYKNRNDAEKNALVYRAEGYDVIVHNENGYVERWHNAGTHPVVSLKKQVHPRVVAA